jgi:cytochrome P450
MACYGNNPCKSRCPWERVGESEGIIRTPNSVFAQVVFSLLARVVYNIYFHPLRHFPGPFLYRATSISWCWSFTNGTLSFTLLRMHEKYGRVVRIRPNELSFADPQAWQDIYGHKVLGKMAGLQPGFKELPKSLNFYNLWDKQPRSILTAPYNEHAALRKMLAPGFSDRAMREQESIITAYIDTLITKLREKSSDNAPLDLVSWYSWTTIDIISDLAFGDSFRCLERPDFRHFVKMMCKSPKENARIIALRCIGLKWLALALLVPLARNGMAMHRHAAEAVKRRMAISGTRPDLIQPYIEKKEEGGLTVAEIGQMSRILIFAGSETTASLLSGVTYLLLTNPETLERLTSEVRSKFGSEKEITLTSVQGLPYMLACLNEALRHYPPAPTGMHRSSPQGGAIVAGQAIPENVSVV